MATLSDALRSIEDFQAAHASAIVVDRRGHVVAFEGDAEHKYRFASLTKPLTALCLLIASEEGVLTLDDPCGPTGATVRHLLAHASGLSQGDRSVALAAPATKRIYSNAGYELLGEHLGRRAGMTYSDYLFAGVLAPLEMTDTECIGSPAASAIGTLADIGRLMGELMEPSLISMELFREATSVAFPGLEGVLPGFGRQSPCDWGLGFEIKGQKSPHWTGRQNSPRSFGHFGQSGTFVLIDPGAGYGLGVLTDRDFGEWAKSKWPPLCDAVFCALRERPIS